MNILELFAGMQCFSNVARAGEHQTFTSDWNNIQGIDYCCDILSFDTNRVPFIPHLIWVSPDCATWSKAAGNIHFESKSLLPKTSKAAIAFAHIDKTISIINYFLLLNPNLKFYIENPEGRLQYYIQAGTIFEKIKCRTVIIDQCQYGWEFQKTTHIFTNDYRWKPRKRCPERPICNHAKNVKNAGSGMKTSLGKLDNLGYYKRAEIPAALCTEIIQSCECQL